MTNERKLFPTNETDAELRAANARVIRETRDAARPDCDSICGAVRNCSLTAECPDFSAGGLRGR
jgi:hypothetical protein